MNSFALIWLIGSVIGPIPHVAHLLEKSFSSALSLTAKAVVDCTGHEAEVLSVAAKKIPELKIDIKGESSMWVSRSEKLTIEKTGLYVKKT